MNVKKYFAMTAKEALYKVRNELGADAVIVSSRTVNGGHEIMAVGETEIAEMIQPAADKRPPADSRKPAFTPNTKEDTFITNEPRAIDAPANGLNGSLQTRAQKMLSVFSHKPALMALESDTLGATAAQSMQKLTSAGLATTPIAAAHSVQQVEIINVMQEIKSMRTDIETQLNELNWLNVQRHAPMKKTVLQRLIKAGLSINLARKIAHNLPEKLVEAEAMRWVQKVIENNIMTNTSDADFIQQGGVYALIGPTGVGKTTTTAKLAAKFVMQHGAQKLALITTDAYRVGGHEQLRIYGKILGVMVHAVKDEADLKLALNELKHKHTILIDTVGMSQKDQMVSSQIAMLSQQNTAIQKILCLNATSSAEHLTDVVQAYRKQGLAGCIMTKIDEAASLGPVVDVLIQEKLKAYYLTNGQRVPEDVHLVNKQWLVRQLFSAKNARNTQNYSDDELPWLVAQETSNQGAEIHYV